MKIVIINGSPRKTGATAAILNEIDSYWKQYQDVEVKVVHVADLDLKYCIGCCACYKTGSCVYMDDIEKLSMEIEEADGIIMGSPTYASNVSGQLKTIIDRGHFVMEQLLQGKYAMSVVTYENYGGKEVEKNLHNLFTYSGARISGTIVCKNEFGKNPLENRKLIKEIRKKAERLYQDIQGEKRYRMQEIRHFIIFLMGIRPFVMRKGEKYSGVRKHWHKYIHG